MGDKTIFARSPLAFFPILRLLAGAALVTAAFFALRDKYQGECLSVEWDPGPGSSYDGKFVFLNSFVVVFVVGWIWFGAESGLAVGTLTDAPMSRIALAAVGAAIAMCVYAGIGVVTWEANPIPGDDETTWKGTRIYLSVAWPIGLLQETGNFHSTFCGE